MTMRMSAMAEKGKEFLSDIFAFKVEGVVKVDSPEKENLPEIVTENVEHNDDNITVKVTESHIETAEETSCLTISVYSAVVIALICTFLVLGRDYIKYVLMSMEETELWISFGLFTLMFTVVSFPMTWGYILFNIAAGYLYGFRLGVLTVMTCALTGLSIAHFVIKRCLSDFVHRKLMNDTVRAIMRVIESGHGFRVVILSRLTPIPFGLQNAIFAISNISYPRYICASALGMAPSQGMHAYIGSTLRSMEEVISGGSSNSVTAYIVFALQLSMVAVLLVYIIKRARRELNRTVHELDTTTKTSASSSSPTRKRHHSSSGVTAHLLNNNNSNDEELESVEIDLYPTKHKSNTNS